jgi:hypothetical protein
MPMGIDWSHLPTDVINKVCMCSYAKNEGFVKGEGEYWVHTKCRKPTIPVAVRQCESCDIVFVPKVYIPSTNLGIECDSCNPPNRVRRGKLNF